MSAPSLHSLLVVDDEPDLCTLYELTLLREGYDVESAGSVEEAWARLPEGGFQLLITDMRLPDGSGLDLLHRLDDAGWVANRWCEILPIPLATRHKLMALPDPVARLGLVDGFLRRHKIV